MEKKPERHEKRAADTTRGAKGTQGARHPQAKKQYYAEEWGEPLLSPPSSGGWKQETDFCRSVIISGKTREFFGERTEYGFPVLVRIMRHRSASPAKSQAFPQLGKAEPARFLGGKITAGIFLPKTRRAWTRHGSDFRVTFKKDLAGGAYHDACGTRMDEVCKLSALFRFSAEIL